ncbi:MAG: hypothetical protein KGJ66_05055 [Alphaproteobacteria bacterium]|nr:hypothetical protein [Alphaproteobacteria bacterium]
MASKAQIAANRRNAAKSTGPKTAAGKVVVARNALRHGLTARQLIIFGEGFADFARFHAELRTALEPADAVEETLAERVVLCAWRLRRMGRIEAAVLKDAESHVGTEAAHGTELGVGFSRVAHAMTVLSRYESTLDRALRQAELQLERRQARRHGEAVAPPVAVTVAGLDVQQGDAAKIKICETNPISESMATEIDAQLTSLAPHPNPLPASGEREDSAASTESRA